jgi:hypothetical protein
VVKTIEHDTHRVGELRDARAFTDAADHSIGLRRQFERVIRPFGLTSISRATLSG